jgi:hypothetical protein
MHEFATIFVPFLGLKSGSGPRKAKVTHKIVQGEDISCFEVLDVYSSPVA